MVEEGALKGSVGVVTGGSRGIGLAIAGRLGEMGARIVICALDPARLADAERSLRARGVEALGVVADVAAAAGAEALVRRANEAFGDIEILVNNAGIGRFGPAHEASEEDWDRTLDTNLKGVWLCSRAVAPQMIRRRRGHIINISSLAGKNALAGAAIYCASKWGLQGLTACMAEELRGYGIRVSAICPGSVHTDFSPHAGKDQRRMLQPEDVAHAVAMLVTQAPQSFISEVLLRPTMKP
jgi:NAD(P)-dependent dehydrogenase (short-subunit alcohol dehydrogenase family)